MNKKAIKMFTAVAMVGALAASSVVPGTKAYALEEIKRWSYGDIDKDGDVDPEDALRVLQYYIEEMSGNPNTQLLSCADVTYDGRIDCEDANEILTAYVNRTLAGREYYMPCESPIAIGTCLTYAGTQAWFQYKEPKTVSSLGTIVPGNELQIVRYWGTGWYEVEIDGSHSFVNIPEGEIGETFLVNTKELDQTTSATTTTTTATTSTSTTSTKKSTTTSVTTTSTEKQTTTTSTTTSTAKLTTTTSTTTSTTKPTTTTSTTTSTTKPTTTTSTTTSTTKPTTTTSTTTSTTKPTTTTSATTSTAKPTTTTSTISTTVSTTTTTTNSTTTPNTTAQFKPGQYIKVCENHFVLKDASQQDIKWLIPGDVVEICSLVEKREAEEEYMVKIVSYHAPFFGFDPETELHMVIPYASNCIELVDFAPEEPQIENIPFEVKDYVQFKGVGWKLLDERMEMTGKYLQNANRFSIEEVVFKDEKGCFYRINVSIDFGKFETAYIYINGADKATYFELTDHV